MKQYLPHFRMVGTGEKMCVVTGEDRSGGQIASQRASTEGGIASLRLQSWYEKRQPHRWQKLHSQGAGKVSAYPREVASQNATTVGWALQVAPKQAPPPMRKDDDRAKYIQAHLFGDGCATETTITEMLRDLEGSHASSTIKDIKRVVQNCRGQDGKKSNAFWYTGKESWWQTDAQEEGDD